MADDEAVDTPARTRGRGRGRGGRGARGAKTTAGRGTKSRKQAEFTPVDEEARFPIGLAEEEPGSGAPATPGLSHPVDESSRGSTGSASASVTTTATKKKSVKYEVFDPDADKAVTADLVFEYQWPANERHADYYMLQEQIADFLGVKSFKRKYPKMTRRNLERDEKAFLKERGIVSDTIFDLGEF